jgi:hypothetical protein
MERRVDFECDICERTADVDRESDFSRLRQRICLLATFLPSGILCITKCLNEYIWQT